ncbi:hypothetical protein B0H14DRAFT_3164150 [Mycena olivaceomarginata]|nr:hypothetical protein B0H14DRAFT_3165837 [Mycena olivaceomarginata]KAJ7780435.1 hypothetical protein B0H14DRAFT_3164150 [Mycena olivaceomarginata]
MALAGGEMGSQKAHTEPENWAEHSPARRGDVRTQRTPGSTDGDPSPSRGIRSGEVRLGCLSVSVHGRRYGGVARQGACVRARPRTCPAAQLVTGQHRVRAAATQVKDEPQKCPTSGHPRRNRGGPPANNKDKRSVGEDEPGVTAPTPGPDCAERRCGSAVEALRSRPIPARAASRGKRTQRARGRRRGFLDKRYAVTAFLAKLHADNSTPEAFQPGLDPDTFLAEFRGVPETATGTNSEISTKFHEHKNRLDISTIIFDKRFSSMDKKERFWTLNVQYRQFEAANVGNATITPSYLQSNMIKGVSEARKTPKYMLKQEFGAG